MIRMRVGLVIFGNGILIEAGAGSGVPKSVLAAEEAKDPDDEKKDLGITTNMDKVRSIPMTRRRTPESSPIWTR
jgi:hypothetical protein